MMKSGRTLNIVAQSIALAPAFIGALIAFVAGFGTISTALLVFTIVISMPLMAAIMSLIYAQTAPQLVAAVPPPMPKQTGNRQVAARLDRHMR